MRKTFQSSGKAYITGLLAKADITVNGSRPRDIQVSNDQFYDRIIQQGSLALGESYMDGWWNCSALDQFFFAILRREVDKSFKNSLPLLVNHLKSRFTNRQSLRRSPEVGKVHYDLGNELFARMLDSSMSYSCGYWRDAENLEQAQAAKLEMICQKLNLGPKMRLLDIGCGWGGLVEYAARHYGVEAVGITISKEQAKLAQERCAGLPVTIRLQDYRHVAETYDAVVSVGMFEHVGDKNYRQFMETVERCLNPEGLFLLHTIGNNRTSHGCDPWFDKYIFPNGQLPSVKQVAAASENFFVMEDWHNFGAHYDKTLMAWHQNFLAAWPELADRYDERFFRMWQYYLLSMAGSFRARYIQLWQVVFSPGGKEHGYTSMRCPACMKNGVTQPSAASSRGPGVMVETLEVES
ncbi:MAG: cyclopropane fatty acyl phospholipid synthase [Desulfopila sp.]